MAEGIEDFIHRAISDPASVVEPHEHGGETPARHATRAVMTLLSVMYGPDAEGYYAGTPAARALMEHAMLRGQVARLSEDVELWRRRAREAGWKLGVDANV